MKKEAVAAKSILKALALGTAGTALTGGAGYAGHQLGYRSGATRATNEMASAFSEANVRENQQIADAFKLFNKKENRAIASDYMRRGMALGAQLHSAGKIKTPAEMAELAKTSSFEDIYQAAFENEIDKLAAAGLISKVVQTLGKSFSRLGKGIGDFSASSKRIAKRKELIGATKGKKKIQSLNKGLNKMKSYRMGNVKETLKGSKAAIGTIGGAGLAGAALS